MKRGSEDCPPFPGTQKPGFKKKREGRNPTTTFWGLSPRNGGNSTGNIWKNALQLNIVNGGRKSETTLQWEPWVDSLLKLSAGYCTFFFSFPPDYPPGNWHIPPQGTFELMIFPFPKVGCNVIVPRRVFSCFLFHVFSTSLIVEGRSHHHFWQISYLDVPGS